MKALALLLDGFAWRTGSRIFPIGVLLGLVAGGHAQTAGVCARVGLRLDQSAVMARTAFRATLELGDHDPASPLRSVSVQVQIRDLAGQAANERFAIEPPTLEGIDRVDGTGTVAANSTATMRWLLIPTDEAAPQTATDYMVGGLLGYELNGNALTVPLEAVKITVHPDAKLELNYFHQRDVFADDPFTPEIEPSVPYILAVMVKNVGAGVAKSLKITSAEPQVVSNEKGLVIDFKLVGTILEGTSLPNTLTLDFGQIDPGQIKIAQWLFTSSLQGFFRDFKATFQHEDSLGSPRLSTIKSVSIHEMLHVVDAGYAFADGRPDFLVNDMPDGRHLPDTLYLSDGTTNPVSVVEQAAVDAPVSTTNLQVQLTAPLAPGWCYLRFQDPGNGQLLLRRVRRSDGVEIAVGTNAWTTDVTFTTPGNPPIRENTLHLLDYNSTGSYTLTYAPAVPPDTIAPSSSVAALPASSGAQIPVSWSGTDGDGSGIAFYDIFVSDNGGAFLPWLERTTFNGAIYNGVQGHTLAFYSIATDHAGNRESPPGMPDATTSVTLVNHAPVLETIPPQFVDEGTEFQFTLVASDPDLPSDRLTYSVSGAPPGMSVNPSTGLIRWLTSEANGSSTNIVTVRVEDSGSPSLSATGAMTVIVREVNQAPILAPIANVAINEGFTLLVTNAATDVDIPANTLAFSFAANPPPGASLDSTNGLFRWRPSETQGPSTNRIGIVVTDNGSPSLSATQYFTVIVRDVLSDFVLTLGTTNVLAGETNSVPINLVANLDLVDLSLLLRTPASQLSNLSLRSVSPEVVSSSMANLGPDEHLLQFILDPVLRGNGTRTIATLGFTAIASPHSAIAHLEGLQLTAHQPSGPAVANPALRNGRVFVIAAEPILDVWRKPELTLRLYGLEGRSYAILSCTNLAAGSWSELARTTLSGRLHDFTGLPAGMAMLFFAATEMPGDRPLLSLARGDAEVFWLRVQGSIGMSLGIESATNPGPSGIWEAWLGLTLTNSSVTLPWTNTGEPRRFFRGVTR